MCIGSAPSPPYSDVYENDTRHKEAVMIYMRKPYVPFPVGYNGFYSYNLWIWRDDAAKDCNGSDPTEFWGPSYSTGQLLLNTYYEANGYGFTSNETQLFITNYDFEKEIWTINYYNSDLSLLWSLSGNSAECNCLDDVEFALCASVSVPTWNLTYFSGSGSCDSSNDNIHNKSLKWNDCIRDIASEPFILFLVRSPKTRFLTFI